MMQRDRQKKIMNVLRAVDNYENGQCGRGRGGLTMKDLKNIFLDLGGDPTINFKLKEEACVAIDTIIQNLQQIPEFVEQLYRFRSPPPMVVETSPMMRSPPPMVVETSPVMKDEWERKMNNAILAEKETCNVRVAEQNKKLSACEKESQKCSKDMELIISEIDNYITKSGAPIENSNVTDRLKLLFERYKKTNMSALLESARAVTERDVAKEEASKMKNLYEECFEELNLQKDCAKELEVIKPQYQGLIQNYEKLKTSAKNCEKAKEECEKAKEELSRKCTEIGTVLGDNDIVKEQCKKQKMEIQELEIKNRELEKKYNTMNLEHQTIIKQQTNQIATLESEKLKCFETSEKDKKNLEELTTKLSNVAAELEKCKSDNPGIEQIISDAGGKIAELTTQVGILNQQLKAKDFESKLRQKEISDNNKKFKECENKNNQLKEELDKIQTENSILVNENDTLQQNIKNSNVEHKQKLQIQKQESLRKLKDKNEENSVIKQEIEELKQKNNVLENQKSAKDTEIENLKKELDQRETTNEKFEEALDKARTELKSLTNDVALSRTCEAITDGIKPIIEKINNDNTLSSAYIENIKNQLIDLTNQSYQKLSESYNIKVKNDYLETYNNFLRTNLKQCTEYYKLKQLNNSVSNSKLEKLIIQYETTLQEYNEKINQQISERSKFEAIQLELSELKAKCSNAETSSSTDKENCQQLTTMVENLREQKNKCEKIINKLKSELNVIASELRIVVEGNICDDACKDSLINKLPWYDYDDDDDKTYGFDEWLAREIEEE